MYWSFVDSLAWQTNSRVKPKQIKKNTMCLLRTKHKNTKTSNAYVLHVSTCRHLAKSSLQDLLSPKAWCRTKAWCHQRRGATQKRGVRSCSLRTALVLAVLEPRWLDVFVVHMRRLTSWWKPICSAQSEMRGANDHRAGRPANAWSHASLLAAALLCATCCATLLSERSKCEQASTSSHC